MITVIIQGYDGYYEHWKAWHYYWKKYWDKSLPWRVIFCTEEIDPPFSDPAIEILKVGKTELENYSLRTIRMAEAVQTDYLMYLVEDFWLTDKVDGSLFQELLEFTIQHNFDFLKIQCNQDEYHALEKTDLFCRRRRLLKFAPKSPWMWNTQAAIWKKSFFLETMRVGESPWEMESKGTERLHALPDARCYMYHWPWYMIPSAVWKGELADPGKQMVYTMQSDLRTLAKYDIYEKRHNHSFDS